jgi:hypothetical protein
MDAGHAGVNRVLNDSKFAVTHASSQIMTQLRENADSAEEQASTFRAHFGIFDGGGGGGDGVGCPPVTGPVPVSWRPPPGVVFTYSCVCSRTVTVVPGIGHAARVRYGQRQPGATAVLFGKEDGRWGHTCPRRPACVCMCMCAPGPFRVEARAVFSTRTNKLEIDIAAVEAKQAEIAKLRKKMVGAARKGGPASAALPWPCVPASLRREGSRDPLRA